MTAPTWLRVGGVPLDTVAAVGDLEITHGRNGPREATWNMALRDTERPSCLVRGAWCEVYAGPHLVSSGPLSEPDWDSKSFAMIGIARLGESAQCLTSAGAMTSQPNTAIDAAIARGAVPWTRIGNFGTTDLAGAAGGTGVDDPDIDSLTDLLNLWAVENISQWYVSADGRLDIVPEDESSPDWLILPGAAALGVADDNVTDRVFLRYVSSADGRLRTASYPATTPAGGIERRALITHLGPMTSTRATAIAEGMYRKAQEGRTGWTNGLDLTAGQIINLGGHDADLALVRGGQTARLLDAVDPRGVGRTLDVVMAESVWRPAEKRIQLNPVGLVARTWEQVMEEANARGES